MKNPQNYEKRMKSGKIEKKTNNLRNINKNLIKTGKQKKITKKIKFQKSKNCKKIGEKKIRKAGKQKKNA